MSQKHIIWSNENLNLDDWRTELLETHPDYSEEELYEAMWETNALYLSDKRVNLNIQLACPILVIADLGLWDGRHMGYKEILSGNIRDCLFSDYEYTTWFVDENGEFRCDDSHHDGTNHYCYRVYRKTASEKQKENLKNKLYDGTATWEDISRVTRKLGPEIGKVYGWTFTSKTIKK